MTRVRVRAKLDTPKRPCENTVRRHNYKTRREISEETKPRKAWWHMSNPSHSRGCQEDQGLRQDWATEQNPVSKIK